MLVRRQLTVIVYNMASFRSTRDAIRHAENVRNALPLNTYIMLLHQAAVSGKMPVLDAHGRAINGAVTNLSGKQRVELVQYLVNKVMPDRPDQTVHLHHNVTPREVDILKMSEEELLSVAYSEFDTETSDHEPAANPDDDTSASSNVCPPANGQTRAGETEIPEFFTPPV